MQRRHTLLERSLCRTQMPLTRHSACRCAEAAALCELRGVEPSPRSASPWRSWPASWSPPSWLGPHWTGRRAPGHQEGELQVLLTRMSRWQRAPLATPSQACYQMWLVILKPAGTTGPALVLSARPGCWGSAWWGDTPSQFAWDWELPKDVVLPVLKLGKSQARRNELVMLHGCLKVIRISFLLHTYNPCVAHTLWVRTVFIKGSFSWKSYLKWRLWISSLMEPSPIFYLSNRHPGEAGAAGA